jgi:hypothetical protein
VSTTQGNAASEPAGGAGDDGSTERLHARQQHPTILEEMVDEQRGALNRHDVAQNSRDRLDRRTR